MSSKKTIKVLVARPLPLAIRSEIIQRMPHFAIVETSKDQPLHSDELLEWILREQPEAVVVTLTEICDRRFIEKLPVSVKTISVMAVGVNNIDVAAAKSRGIRICSTPHVLTQATADFTWALILGAARRIEEGARLCREGKFEGWSPTMLLGVELREKQLGIIGLGRIGAAVADRAKGFGMNVCYYNRQRSQSENGATYVPNLFDLVRKSDVISIHCPLNPDSFHLFNDRVLRECRRTSILVNVSRGPVVDEAALVRALDDGYFSAVGLDVFENEPSIHSGLFRHHRVLMTPHMASATTETREKMMFLAVFQSDPEFRI